MMSPDTTTTHDPESLLEQIVRQEQLKLQHQLGFVQHFVPATSETTGTPQCGIFLSPNWQHCHRLLLILTNARGLQPGIWSRSLVLEAHAKSSDGRQPNPMMIVNGSMLPYCQAALEQGYGVVIFNPSSNHETRECGRKVSIPHSDTPEAHVSYVWTTYLSGLRSSPEVYVVAHARGGELVKHLIATSRGFCHQLVAIAFVESSHRVSPGQDSSETLELIGTRAINWQRSRRTPGSQLEGCPEFGCLCLSAGEPVGINSSSNTAWTIAASMPTVFAFFHSAQGSASASAGGGLAPRSSPGPSSSSSESSKSTTGTGRGVVVGRDDDHHHGHPSLSSSSSGENDPEEHMNRRRRPAAAAGRPVVHNDRDHIEDAEMIMVVDNDDDSTTTSSQPPSRSMVITTSMDVSDFELLSVVGKGAYGKVYLATKKSGRNAGRVYAMKVLRKDDVFKKKQVEHTQAEQRILKHVEHPFIVRLRYAFQNRRKLYLVMDYYNGGSLFVHLRKSGRFEPHVARFYAAQLFLALSHLHSLNIMYRDLKLENILMDARGYIAMTDFGLSKEDAEGSTFVGTPEYLAPELLSSQRMATSYGTSIDWWSYGVLVYELLVGETPFVDKNRRQMFQNILTGEPRYDQAPVFQRSGSESSVCLDFCQKMLVKNPTERLGCGAEGPAAIMTHAWFRDFDWEALYAREMKSPYCPHEPKEDVCERDTRYVPTIFKTLEVSHSANHNPPSLGGGSTGTGRTMQMHFEGFSYMGSMDHQHLNSNHHSMNKSSIESRASLVFCESDLRMDMDTALGSVEEGNMSMDEDNPEA